MAKTVIDSNPFAADDPFQPPESQQKYAPDDYFANNQNPYEPLAKTPTAQSGKAATVKDAVASAPNYSDSAYSDAARAKDASAKPPKEGKAEELAQREEQLLRREAALLAREKTGTGTAARESNWPSKCYPITYHDISVEIPERHRALVRKFYANLMLVWLALLLNWMLVMYTVFSTDETNSPDQPSTTAALWSSVYLALGVPGSWNLWYRSVYNGTKLGASSKWMFFFANYAAHTIFCLVMTLGPSPSSVAGGGLLFMIEMIHERNHEAVIFCVITLILWGLNSGLGLYLIKHAHHHWKTDGHQDHLRKEMATAIVTAGVDSATSGRV